MPFIGPWEIALIVGIILFLYLIYWVVKKATQPKIVYVSSTTPQQQQPIIIQQPSQTSTIVKEVVMIPCKYCGALTPQTSTYCSNCGAPRR